MLLALCLLASTASALEVTLEGGPASVASASGAGGLARLGFSGTAGPNQRLDLGLQLLAWRDAEERPGRAALSLRWMRDFTSESSATPFVMAGLDLGLTGARTPEELVSEGLALSGQFGAGVRVPLSERLFAPLMLLATVGAGPPALVATVGVGWSER